MTGADRTALYRLYDEAGQLLYVGITTYPPKRFVEHERDKPWWPEVARRDVEWVASRAQAETAEMCAIAAEGPRYNLIHNIGRLITPGPTPEAAKVFADFKHHYEARRALEPEVMKAADRDLKAGATVGQLAAWTGLTPEVFRRRARALGVERKRPPTVGKLSPAPAPSAAPERAEEPPPAPAVKQRWKPQPEPRDGRPLTERRGEDPRRHRLGTGQRDAGAEAAAAHGQRGEGV